jgi:hypothetical protein
VDVWLESLPADCSRSALQTTSDREDVPEWYFAARRGRQQACNSRPTVESTQISETEPDFWLRSIERLWRTVPMSKSENAKQNCFSMEEFCFRNTIGRTTAYKEIKEGRLHPRKVGRRTLISVEEEARWFASSPAFGELRHD